jgi:hypothetical protein
MSSGFPSQQPFGPPSQQPSFQQPSFPQQSFQQPPRRSGISWLVGLLLVFVGFLVLGGVVCVAGVWYVASNIDKWVVGLGREAIVAAINDSELPDGEKTEVITQVDRLVTAYKEKRINQQDLERVMTELQDAPALKALALYGIEDEFLAGAELPPAELEAAHRTFERALRGVYEGKINDEVFYKALPGYDDDQPVRLASTNPADADSTSEDDLRELLVKLKVMADNAQIPDEAFQLDIGDEVKKLVDRALEGK